LNPFLFLNGKKPAEKGRMPSPQGVYPRKRQEKTKSPHPQTRRAGTLVKTEKALRTAQINKQTHPANEQTAGLLRYAISTTSSAKQKTQDRNSPVLKKCKIICFSLDKKKTIYYPILCLC